jgi:hypothetical protein
MMLGLERLTERLERDYRRADYDEARFPAIATRALEDLPPIDDFHFDQLTAWMTDPTAAMSQDDVVNTFSDVRATLARGTGFNIQLLIWVVGSTDMHAHSFSGAFTVLRGSSIHTIYRMETIQRISAGARRIRCTVQRLEWLRPGDVRPIASGAEFVHSTFHLEEPTLSLVVRTDHEPWSSPPLVVFPPHYAVASEWLRRDGRVPMLSKAFRAMHKLGVPGLNETFIRRIAELDFPRACALLRAGLGLFDPSDVAGIVAEMLKVHGPIADGWPDVVRRSERIDQVRRLREHVDEPEARKILAALMLAEDRRHAEAILDLFSIGAAALENWGRNIPAIAKLWATLPIED